MNSTGEKGLLTQKEKFLKLRKKATTKKLEEEKQSKNSCVMIELSKVIEVFIDGKEMHNRLTVDSDGITLLAEEIKKYKDDNKGVNGSGLIHPITVRNSEYKEGYFERIIGYRRVLAFLENGYTHIPAFIEDADDLKVRELRNSENMQRENLNPYDELVCFLELVSFTLKMPEEKVVRFLKDARRHLDKSKDFAFTENETNQLNEITSLIKSSSKYNGVSGLIKRLKLLEMQEQILDAIKNKKISYSHAERISKIKDDALLNETLEYSINQNPIIADLELFIKEKSFKIQEEPIAIEDDFQFIKEKIKKIKTTKIKNYKGDKNIKELLTKLNNIAEEINKIIN